MHLCLAVRCQITCKNWHNLIIWRTCSDTNCHRNCQFAWHGLQLLCISLCRNLLKTMNCPAADHAEILILAGRVSNFYALAYAAACLPNVVYLIAGDTEILILAETVFIFYALVSGGACLKLWVFQSQAMSKHWFQLWRSAISMHWLMLQPA